MDSDASSGVPNRFIIETPVIFGVASIAEMRVTIKRIRSTDDLTEIQCPDRDLFHSRLFLHKTLWVRCIRAYRVLAFCQVLLLSFTVMTTFPSAYPSPKYRRASAVLLNG